MGRFDSYAAPLKTCLQTPRFCGAAVVPMGNGMRTWYWIWYRFQRASAHLTAFERAEAKPNPPVAETGGLLINRPAPWASPASGEMLYETRDGSGDVRTGRERAGEIEARR